MSDPGGEMLKDGQHQEHGLGVETRVKAELLAAIVDSSDDAILAKRLDGTILSWNRGAERIFGYCAEEAIGRNIGMLIPEELRKDEEYIVAQLVAGKRVEHFETVRLHKDGRKIGVSLTVSPIHDAEGRVVGASKIARDITAHKRAELALKASEERYAMLVNGLRVGIWEWDLVTNEQYWSPRMKEIVGINDKSFVPLFAETEAFLHPEDRERVVALLQAHMQKLGPCDTEFRVHRPGGGYAWVHVTGQATWDESGKPLRMVGTMDDITERNRMEAKLRAVVDYAIDGLITIDERGNVESFNPACERIFGYSSAEVIGQNIKMLMPEPYHSEHDGYLSHYAATGEARIIGTSGREVSGLRHDGTVFPMDLAVSAFQLEDGRHYSGVIRDITARKATEEEFRNSAIRFRAIIDTALDGLITIDSRATVQSFNASAERIFGYSSAEVIGQNVKMLMPEPFHTSHDGYVGNYLKTGEAKIIGIGREVTGRRKDGSVFPMDLGISHVKIGNEVLFVGIVRDITARKLAEENSALLTSIVASSDDAILSTTMEGLISSWNPGAERMFGFTAAEVMGKDISAIFPAGRLEESKEILDRLRKGENVQRLDTVRMSKHGQCIEISLSASPVRDKDGKLIGAGRILRNLGERKNTERELLRRAQALEAANQELDAFAYAASHDLKAPLRVIHNASTWLEEDLEQFLTPETRENMALLRARVRRMEKLLDDLLEYSRIGRKTDNRYAEVISGAVLLENILELLAPPEGFAIEVSPSLHSIQVCRMPLQQILFNLIANAIKHHDKETGHIAISVQDLATHYRFSVKDDGPGIPPRFHEQIFGMFQTLKPRDQVEGSGMGLAMVRKHVEVAGGKIELESAVGQGSTFSFTWPKRQARAESAKPELTHAGGAL